jgi:hypothetical protein
LDGALGRPSEIASDLLHPLNGSRRNIRDGFGERQPDIPGAFQRIRQGFADGIGDRVDDLARAFDRPDDSVLHAIDKSLHVRLH